MVPSTVLPSGKISDEIFLQAALIIGGLVVVAHLKKKNIISRWK